MKMKTFDAYKLLSQTPDGKLWSYNSVVVVGDYAKLCENSLYFAVEYKLLTWARPKLKGTKLFALKDRISRHDSSFLLHVRLFRCKVTTPEDINRQVNCPYADEIASLWEHRDTWHQEPLLSGTILVGKVMLLEEVDFLQ